MFTSMASLHCSINCHRERLISVFSRLGHCPLYKGIIFLCENCRLRKLANSAENTNQKFQSFK